MPKPFATTDKPRWVTPSECDGEALVEIALALSGEYQPREGEWTQWNEFIREACRVFQDVYAASDEHGDWPDQAPYVTFWEATEDFTDKIKKHIQQTGELPYADEMLSWPALIHPGTHGKWKQEVDHD